MSERSQVRGVQACMQGEPPRSINVWHANTLLAGSACRGRCSRSGSPPTRSLSCIARTRAASHNNAVQFKNVVQYSLKRRT